MIDLQTTSTETSPAAPAIEGLEDLAHRLAQSHRLATSAAARAARQPLITLLQPYGRRLMAVYTAFRVASEAELVLSFAAEWVLDNYYVVLQALREIGEDLPGRYYRQLPKLAEGPLAGYPRVYDLARQVIAFSRARLDLELVRRFILAYQSEAPLSMGELWALPVMLRLGVAESLIQAAEVVLRKPAQNEPAIPGAPPSIEFPSPFTQEEIVASSVTSLRSLDAQDWKEFFESLSLVEQALSRDPAGLYKRMDFETRDRYRKVVEELAETRVEGEVAIARLATQLAQERLDALPEALVIKDSMGFGLPRNLHVGYYLLDRGRAALEARCGYQPPGLERLRRRMRSHPTGYYLGGIAFLALALLGIVLAYAARAGGGPVALAWMGILGLVPALTLAVDIVHLVVTHLVKPERLPKMDFQDGLPAECGSLVTVPALLVSPNEVRSLLEQLELHYLRNPDPRLSFALLSDFTDAPQEHLPEDDGLLELAQAGIRALNEKYRREANPPFYLFHRPRQWNPGERAWMGWERKRGKLQQLNQLALAARQGEAALQEAGRPFYAITGDLSVLASLRYIVTLDADTILPRDSGQRLVAALAHPLNRAKYDPRTGRVTAGYTILQPRTAINPASANRSLFTRIFTGQPGLDLYTLAISDVYQDLFGEGIYVGKGIYDIEAFQHSLEGQAPENALLSHDLFEGIHGRAGLVTDITLIEDYPSNYLAQSLRQRRWIRGDWQLLPWLFDSSLSVISRWKILDNLRRSLQPPLLLLFLVAGWLLAPGKPWAWTLAGLFSLSAPFLHLLFSELLALRKGKGRSAWRGFLIHLKDGFLRWLLSVVFLPYEALSSIRAAGVTVWRMYVSHRQLLRWTTAAQVSRRLGGELTFQTTGQAMFSSLVLTLFLGLLTWRIHPLALLPALPLLAAWALGPALAYQISLPIQRAGEPLSMTQEQKLRRLAMRTWLFFELYVGPEDSWLPPDHFQEAPLGIIAHHTSPTNLGLYVLSILGAYDLGYVGLLGLTTRFQYLFETMQKLELFRGHFLNWYDTRTREPLQPRYVSTVDSGNLAACLITLRQGLTQVAHAPVLRWETFQAILDGLDLLDELVSGLPEGKAAGSRQQVLDCIKDMKLRLLGEQNEPASWVPVLLWLSGPAWENLNTNLLGLLESVVEILEADQIHRLRLYTQRLRYRLDNAERELQLLMPWLLMEAPPPWPEAPAVQPAWAALQATLWPQNRHIDGEIGAVSLERSDALAEASRHALEALQQALDAVSPGDEQRGPAIAWFNQLRAKIDSGLASGKVLRIGLEEISRQAERFIKGIDFTFLFDRRRQVFHIGYNAATGRLDNNYYDLLESEARIASLVAIAQGNVPQSHWLHLSRPLTEVDDDQVLLSWSATMFEYLMPGLLMRSYHGTLLNNSANAAVRLQMEYAAQSKTPWGISESGYYRFDSALNYQYRAFGVPGLGYKRGLADDLVIAPYASLLALNLQPQAVAANLDQLEACGAMGALGLYEALDFTPSRLGLGERYALVSEYMAHHQGMILISLANYFTQDRMVQRFHADARIQSVELLLHEQVPHGAPLEQLSEERNVLALPQAKITATPWRVRVRAPQPAVHYLSNGRYSVLLSSAGGGFSRWDEVDLTRWRPDATLDDWGTWYYVQDLDGLEPGLWSAGFQPTGIAPRSRDVYFNAHMAEFQRQDGDITTVMEVVVPPEDNLEVRRITLTNHSDQPRRLQVTSYGEVVLADQGSDARHPAFNHLFIEHEWLPLYPALLFHRRPRSQGEKPIFMLHSLVMEPGSKANPAPLTDRAAFLGRGGSARNPAYFQKKAKTTKTGPPQVTPYLDPIFSLTQVIELAPHSSIQMGFLTLAAEARPAALAMLERYSNWQTLDRSFDQARSVAEIELRRLGMTVEGLVQVQRLLSALVYPQPALRPPAEVIALNQRAQPGLWAFGISGDYPILLLKINRQEELPLAQELIQAHTYWRSRQLRIDLVILNMEGADYGGELSKQILRILAGPTQSDGWLNRRGGIFMLSADRLNPADQVLLETVARVALDAGHGPLTQQLEGLDRLPGRLPPFAPNEPGAGDFERTPLLPRPEGLLFDNGLGGFSPDGREYLIYLEKDQSTPAPWINVIANAQFGCLASESSLGSTWSINSGENRLTPWSNDPVSDTPAEALYLRDEETGRVWTPTRLPAGEAEPYLARHGAGYSQFEHHSHGLLQRLRLFCPPGKPVKIVQLRIENAWQHVRRVTVTYYAEWVLGLRHEASVPFVVCEFDNDSQALLAYNHYNGAASEFDQRVAFAAASRRLHGLTADRTEFLGRLGSRSAPAALGRIGLAGAVQARLDPCAALQVHLDLQPGESEEVYFILGQGEDRVEALALVDEFKDPSRVQAAWQELHEFWEGILGAVEVHTPDKSMDVLLNRWLLYQTLACRIWGRTALYQSSGAYGFRDQLQDVLALLYTDTPLARQHILLAAGRQFEAGDVLHWWHPPSGRGVRTRFSDDLLWLPYVTAEYVQATGDESILNEMIPFLSAPALGPKEEDRYGIFPSTTETYSLFEHCRRAIEYGTTQGPHGLPLMKSGDWNDGMNRVGVEGKGESVWLGWFLAETLQRFAGLFQRRGQASDAQIFLERSARIVQALESQAWDGNWYLRAFYDDGVPMGSAQNNECRLDSIPQSWAVLSGLGQPERARKALESASQELVLPADRLALLFTPPFDHTRHDPGYIKGYLPGVRENGGQYTHAATWLAWAWARLGEGDQAAAIFNLLNPIQHAGSPAGITRYGVEPYVVAADVYHRPQFEGRGGWTWYTGSSGWMYRLGIQAILGLQLENGALRLDPCIPKAWPGYEMTCRLGQATYHIVVENPQGVSQGIQEMVVNGERVEGNRLPAILQGRVELKLVLGK